jgi:hypothetical protein
MSVAVAASIVAGAEVDYGHVAFVITDLVSLEDNTALELAPWVGSRKL